jgi:hypothetical protein
MITLPAQFCRSISDYLQHLRSILTPFLADGELSDSHPECFSAEERSMTVLAASLWLEYISYLTEVSYRATGVASSYSDALVARASATRIVSQRLFSKLKD